MAMPLSRMTLILASTRVCGVGRFGQLCKELYSEPREDVQRQVQAELADVDVRIGRLTEAIQLGGALGPLVADLKTLTTRREHLQVRLTSCTSERRVGIADLRALEAELRGYLAQWSELLHHHA
jgi:hypothetical protein